MSRHAAIEYLRSPPDAPWKWEEDGRVLAWSDGTTVLFREELNLIVERLAPHGLPPFPALVVLLAACRGKIPDPSAPAEAGDGRGQLLLALHSRRHQQAAEELKRISRLPPELIGRAPGQAVLAGAVFERAKRLSAADSDAVMRGWQEAWGDTLNTLPVDAAPLGLAASVLLVGEGLRRHSAESLQLRLRTGLDALPVAMPEIELPREERMRRLLDALGADHEQAGLALVIRDLMAALRLPRILTQADETAAEGVSDIGNRGPLDRLVLSELAYDDLTLATRVALNEALYLRREPPAQRPQRSLAVLLDAGLRMWGVPRVLGVAGALALISRHPSGCAALSWTARGRAIEPVDLLTAKGLEAQLAVLSTDLHPGASLPALQTALTDHPEVDAVIVTHRDALADAAFQAQLAQAKFARGFLLLVERDGLVQLHPLPWGAPRPLAEARVDIEKLFPRPKQKPAAVPLLDAQAANEFPAIFRERPFPLLLPVRGKMERSMVVGSTGGVCVTTDGRLLHWTDRASGARQLATDLPGGRTCWLGVTGARQAVVLKGRAGDGRGSVTIAEMDQAGASEPRITRFSGPHHPRTACLDRDVLLVVLHTRVVAVELTSGEVLVETLIPAGMRWVNGRYFVGADGLYFISWGGTGTKWTTAVSGRQLKPYDVVTAFDRDGIGAWVLTREGKLFGPSGAEAMNFGFSLCDARIWPDGEQLLIRRVGAKAEWYTVNLKTKAVYFTGTPNLSDFGPPVVASTRNLQSNFTGIWAAPGQPLALRTKHGRWTEIVFSKADGFEWRPVEGGKKADGEVQPFSAIMTPARLGCRLQLARWPGGSRAWLDNRGLLHLKSPDSGTPEITLVLVSQLALAGWTSDGHCCGPDFFTEGKATNADAVNTALVQFCQGVC